LAARLKETYMAGILWIAFLIIVGFWLLGFIMDIAGNAIHFLLVIAVLVLLYNLFIGRRSA
jgi:hypothetical protein